MGPRKEFTFPQEWKRKAVLFAICTRHNNATIAKFFDLTTTWVWKVRNQLEKSGGDYGAVAKRPDYQRRLTSLPASDPGSAAVWGSKRINPRPQFCLCLAWSGCPSNNDNDDQRRSDCLRTAKFINRVKNAIDKDMGKSMRAIAKDMRASEALIRRCVSEDLRYKSYKMKKGQLLTAKAKKKRLKHCQKLLNKLKHPLQRNMIWFFSDKKNFCQDQAVNNQNNHWLAVCSEDVPKVMQTKFPATVMVFGVVHLKVTSCCRTSSRRA